MFELIVIVISWMTRKDKEWSLEQTWIVNSSSFGSRFGTVGLGHNSWQSTGIKLNTKPCQCMYMTHIGETVKDKVHESIKSLSLV